MIAKQTLNWTVAGVVTLVLTFGHGAWAARMITWDTEDGIWDTDSANTPWRLDSTLADTAYIEGDHINFRRHIPAGTHTISIQAGGVEPGSFTTHAGSGNTYHLVFDGGDITGGMTMEHNIIVTTLTFQRAGSYSFTGGVSQNAPIVYAPQLGSPGGNYQFGSGTITLNDIGRAFTFAPSESATLTNAFAVGSGGGQLAANSNAQFDSAVDMGGTLRLQSVGVDYSGLTLNLTGNRELQLAAVLGTPRGRFDGMVNGSDHILTLNNHVGAGLAFFEIGGPGGWDIGGIVKTGISKLLLDADGSTFFDGITANGGKVSVLDGGIVRNSSHTGTFNVGFHLELVDPGYMRATTINVESDGRLSGTGEVIGNLNVSDNGVLSPGLSIGTLTVTGDLELSDNSILDFEFDGADSDLIAVSGDLTLNGTMNAAAAVVGQTYTLFTYGGFITDLGLDVTGLPSYLRTEIETAGGLVTFMAIPEPSAFALMALASTLLAMRRRRRW